MSRLVGTTKTSWVQAISVILIVAASLLWACEEQSQESRLHVEEFRVAEPLTAGDGESTTIQDQLETITAVTEPYDEVEAAVEEEPGRLAESTVELHQQCMTILREMAFCTNEDSYLDIIGTAPNLRTSEERERFMNRVEFWYEPGGSSADCTAKLRDGNLSDRRAKHIFQRAAEATQVLCDDFGEVLIDVDAFALLAPFWED